MPNLHRGEIAAELGGTRRTLVLTLGALAELEAAFGADDLAALAQRFAQGRMSARDLIRIIGAGLRGAGETLTDDEIAKLSAAGGAEGFVRIAAALLEATFGARRPRALGRRRSRALRTRTLSLGSGDRLCARHPAAAAGCVLENDHA